jgi:ABC-type dipeptide/oligopeptide/nickel transport system permease subunit
MLAVLAFNIVGDGLRDALDPRTEVGGRNYPR